MIVFISFYVYKIFSSQKSQTVATYENFQVDDMVDWQQRVSLAMFKWANGRVLLVHALTQITFGINRWMDVKAIDREYVIPKNYHIRKMLKP